MKQELVKAEPNPIFPTDDNLDITWARAKALLPIMDENTLFTLLQIHQNTILKQLGISK